MQTKKGFILIYTILVGIVCLSIMMYIFDSKMSEFKYSTSNKKYVLKEDNYQRDKEYLMTLFFTYINANKENIKSLPNSLSSIVEYSNAKVIHASLTNEFIFITPNEAEGYRYDYFNLSVIGEKFKLIFLKTEYRR